MPTSSALHVGWVLVVVLLAQDVQVHPPSEPALGGQPAKRNDTVSHEVRSLIDEAEALPPEFSSDLVLQLLEKGLVQDRPLSVKLLKQAFERASAARDDFMRRPWGSKREEDPDGFHAIASEYTGLDKLSLQTRVVRLALLIDPRLGRRFFESIQPPQIAPAVCNQKWRAAPDSYYDTLGEVSKTAFSGREISNGARASFVDSIIQNCKSHVQVLLIARMLSTANLTESELREALPRYAATLNDVGDDPQSFGILMSGYDEFFDATHSLVTLLNKRHLDSSYLVQALREYLVMNYKRRGCSTGDASQPTKSGLPAALSRFNELFQNNLARANLAAIAASEIKRDEHVQPEQPLPTLQWKSQAFAQLLLAVQDLDPPVASTSTQSEIAWSTKVRDLLGQLNDWSDPNESETDFFRQKAMLMESVCERTNGTPIHTEALSSFRIFLEQNSYEEVDWIDWFIFAKKLLATSVRKDTPRGDLDAFLDSRDPVLSVYARLQLLLLDPRKYTSDSRSTQSDGTREHE